MKRFIVVNRMEPDKAVAYLSYDPKNRNFQLSLNKNARKEAFQGMLRVFYDKKMYEPGEKWSARWVRERVTPSERQGMETILRENRMKCYDEMTFLEKNRGLSVQDDLMIKPIGETKLN